MVLSSLHRLHHRFDFLDFASSVGGSFRWKAVVSGTTIGFISGRFCPPCGKGRAFHRMQDRKSHPSLPSAIRCPIAQQCNRKIDPELLSLRNSTSGRVTSVMLKIRNRHFDPMTIDRVKSSCPCLMVKVLPVRLGACESLTLMERYVRPVKHVSM